MTYKKQLEKRVLAGLLAGAALWLGMPAALAASGAVPNTQLPQGGSVMAGNASIGDPNNGQLTITQGSQNAVIQWGGGFNIGANATVNFKGPESGYNTLNYDASGSMSQIYGAINANNNGNIYIVNPSGVEISSSAQINVGSLYVSNRDLSKKIYKDMAVPEDISAFVQGGETTDAALMSLGNINAANVTFDGGRIVIDTERLKTGDAKMDKGNIHVRTTDAGQVVLGYDAYNEGEYKETYDGKQKFAKDLATVTAVDGSSTDNLKGYMWVEDIEQLQAVNTNLSGQYALRNSIDATATKDLADGGFKPIIGKDDTAFTGKFDGLDYNIFNLNINRNTDNVGLFSVVGNGAVIRNVTLVGGSITGGSNVGALAGQVSGGAQISNIMNSASVTGSSNVGGLIGSADQKTIDQETTDQEKLVFKNLVNTGTVQGDTSVGGLIGSLTNGTLSGTSYNLGGVTGNGYNVGGLVGTASGATLGDGTNLIYNRLNVSGLYNVGGIVGSMTGTTVENAENSGNVTATGHTTEDYAYHTSHWKDSGGKDKVQEIKNVYVANVGGIAGKSDSTGEKKSEIKNVQNSGDVSSGTAEKTTNGTVAIEYSYYTAGNVGGIVGRAEDTNITDATNTENDVRGAHNVGGIAGYFGSSSDTVGRYTITRGVNNGGDILATGAVDENTVKEENTTDDSHNNGFVTEWVRSGSEGGEKAIIGNMGGIAGYMDGDNVYIASSANRGTVHSQDIDTEVLPVSQAANAGGIVGKIDRSHTIGKNDETGIIDTKNIKNALGENYANAAVSNSYNTGDVRGYMGVGGVAGMMYNGEIAGSYNLGTVNTTRNKDSFTIGNYYAVNMGGVVGDTTEQTEARALLYDVYNKGQIGDETFNYYARHVGGVVGRLSGAVEKAYNTGAIYNGYSIVGGIVGWLNAGSVTNSFNTGNITVLNHDNTEESNVGGIAGDVNIATGNIVLTNVYNLGTLRSIQYKAEAGSGDNNGNVSVLGGIVGAIHSYHDNKNGKLLISNAYTTGNLYSDDTIKSIVGSGSATLTNTYYIHPADTDSFEDLVNTNKDNSNKAIAFADKDKAESYAYDSNGIHYSLEFTKQDQGSGVVDGGSDDITADDRNWRIYAGSTPILNAFLPNTEKYFSGETGVTNAMDGISSIQYGTAYDPLLTIIDAGKNTQNLTFDWQKLGVNNAAGIAVYGAGLTLDNFKATGGSGYFGGMIYSDGALSIASESGGDVALGSASQLYGSSVSISAGGNVTIYGDVTATGNTQDGTTSDVSDSISVENPGNISITGGSVDVYGQLTSAKKGNTTFVPGINNMADGWTPGDVDDPKKPMTDIGDRFGYTTGASTVTGSISIKTEKNENTSEDGHVNVYYGHQQKGFLDTAKDLTVKASGDVYMDSDLSIGGNLSITSPGEMILDISNIGKVQKDNGTVTDSLTGLHTFLHHFGGTDKGTISFAGTEGTAADAKITVDMWDDKNHKFDLTKYDSTDHELVNELDDLNFSVSGADADKVTAKDHTYIWVSTGEQLAGIQQAVKGNSSFLGYNFALKNDIDASAVKDYVAIGTDSANGFTGTFDGRDNRIIGLKVDTLSDGTAQSNAGIFDTIGTVKDEKGAIIAAGKVEDLRVYSGTFNGTDNAGAVAGINKGTISNVTTFGNVVTAKGSSNSTEMSGDTADTTVRVGAAGGIAGVNAGTIDNASASDAVTAAAGTDGALSTAGGIAGINEEKAVISNSSSDSAVNASAGSTYGLGGIAGVNAGTLSNVDSLGTITGGRDEKDGYYKYQIYNNGTIQVGTWTDSDRDGIIDTNEFTAAAGENIGGLFGTNNENVTAAYNTGAIIAGSSTNVGGIAGTNTGTLDQVFNTVMTADGKNQTITGGTNVGGIVGSNTGTVSNAYNTSDIIGTNIVGGIAGNNDGKISTVFTTQENQIVGNSETGTGTGTGTVKNGLVLNEDTAKNSGNYTGFGLEGDGFSKESSDVIWKIYDGSSMALLKVFLTKAEVTKDPNLVYNGQKQVIGTDSITAVHGDVTIPPLGQNSHKDAGSYDDWLYSSQIAASKAEDGTFNPNHLGYDIEYTTEIDKAVITVTGNTVDRTYGNRDITSSTDGTGVLIGGKGNYGFTIGAGDTATTITEAMKEELTGNNLGFGNTEITDNALLSKESGKTTDNVSDKYTWSTDLKLNADLEKNYTFSKETDSTKTTVSGESHVNKANLTITAKPETIYVGGTPHYTGTVNSFVNGDSFSISFGVEDSSLESTVGTYAGKIGFWFGGQFYLTGGWENEDLFGGNYNIKFTPGTLTVKDLPSGMPDIPDSEKWNSLLRDTPWDRNRNFRERKAEIHFIAGGMSY